MCIRDRTSTADGWLTLSPASGDAGETEVTLTVGENGTGALRSGEVTVSYTHLDVYKRQTHVCSTPTATGFRSC